MFAVGFHGVGLGIDFDFRHRVVEDHVLFADFSTVLDGDELAVEAELLRASLAVERGFADEGEICRSERLAGGAPLRAIEGRLRSGDGGVRIAHGISHIVGSLEVGKLADLVVFKPALFGVKPELVLKGGFIAWANMGDPNASIPTPQPTFYRPQFGAAGKALASTCVTFVSQASLRSKTGPKQLGLSRRIEAVKHCRKVGKKDMVLNDALPEIEVDPETYTVKADGRILTCDPAKVLPMAQRYFLF